MPVKILIVRFSSLGDVILTTPIIRRIAAVHPDADITLATKAEYADLFHTNPNVSRVVALGRDESLRTFGARVATHAYEMKIDLHSSLRSIWLRRRIPGGWLVYRKPRLRRFLRLGLGFDGVPLAPMVAQYAGALPFRAGDHDLDPLPEVFLTVADEARAAELIHQPAVVLAPGAGKRAKQWPVGHWSALAAKLREQGFNLVGVGRDSEAGLVDHPAVVSAFGEPLRVIAALMRASHGVVAMDSGLMHLASAVGARLVALFGPTDPSLGYRPQNASAAVIGTTIGCRPCSLYGRDRCPLGHHRCMTELRPSHVLNELVPAPS